MRSETAFAIIILLVGILVVVPQLFNDVKLNYGWGISTNLATVLIVIFMAIIVFLLVYFITSV